MSQKEEAAEKPEFVGENFGQKRPPLSVTIKQILDRYPDGQIFKEMIQNADDAGARKVQFFIDSRSHGSKSLVHPSLAEFQGPALLSANDATFSEQDWKGIQSLQQSVKADDPFKVGRFGIGFNSVYHLTDVPMIISGEKVAYLEPQEYIWPEKSGRSFTLAELQNTDNITPFDQISDFKSNDGMISYPKTIFRFPLRTKASKLSETLYDVSKVQTLINALREEAKLLLIFLRSIDTIEVYNISEDGTQYLSFKTEISERHKQSIARKRKKFLDELRSSYDSKLYDISTYIDFCAKFSIEVSGNDLQEHQRGKSDWLVCNQVGSEKKEVLDAAPKQKVFPWVGTALELGEEPESGRIFCFLPMPIEAASKLPIHVNGTFGLTDDRRSLKWPGVERKNDATADWNKILVREVLPRCYVSLLCEAKKHISYSPFYKAWPLDKMLKRDTWGNLLKPFYDLLLDKEVMWFQKVPKKEGEWIRANDGMFVKQGTTINMVIRKCLVLCGMKVVCVPQNVWAAIKIANVQVKEITPRLVCNKLRAHAASYTNLDKVEKHTLLEYCLSEKPYSELIGLVLLPLMSGKFIQFEKETQKKDSRVYVATESCPSCLLPNLPHIIVDLTIENPALHKKLVEVAESKTTQMKSLIENVVADLLQKAMPECWKGQDMVTLPNENFPTEWFEKFWKWIDGRNLKLFSDKLVLPVSPHKLIHDQDVKFCAIKLMKTQAVIHVSSGYECEEVLEEALNKLGVSICREEDFSFVRHKNLKTFIKICDTNGLLDAVSASSNHSKVELSFQEAKVLRDFLKPSTLAKRAAILDKLEIFTTAVNTNGKLSSTSLVKSESTLKKAIGAPKESCLDISKLPPSMLMFSQCESQQVQLLQKLNVSFPNDCQFIVKHIFPMLRSKSIPDALVDEIMVPILTMFNALTCDKENGKSISEEIKSLPFVRINTASASRKSPQELFDPRDEEIAEIFRRELLFPISPYESDKHLDILKEHCGLRRVIKPVEILEVINSIGISSRTQLPHHVDRTKLIRSRAVLSFICKDKFLRELHDSDEAEDFCKKIAQLSLTKCWLPVLSSPPAHLNYPSKLTWKGSGLDSHLMSLQATPYHITAESECDKETALLVGSQVYLTDPPLHPEIASMFPPCEGDIFEQVLGQMKEIIACRNDLIKVSEDSMLDMLHRIYNKLLNSPKTCDVVIPEWLYIRKWHKFVSPKVVALAQNSTFRQNLEPYIYLLPETLTNYKDLFLQFGMHMRVTQDQVLSVLGKIRDEISCEESTLNSGEAWSLVMSILNWLTQNDVSDLIEKIYIPTDSDINNFPCLKKASEVLFTDSEFLKEFAQSESDMSLLFAHPKIHKQMAEFLGLKMLSEELDISEDAFEDTGQHEPLTSRLKTILKDYKDGLTIVKELLQNADDAEATEFNICFDNRTHPTQKERLFFQGMLEAHGPALIVHNNKTFTEEDFVNITKLAGATKENKQLKIGKFGLGFCSVYHITDVPSFVSRDLLHIFDPTLSYLTKEIKNPSKPGKKVKFTQKMISRSEQLDPYVGLFGFDKTREYDGTIFRLPFRKNGSELSGKCYDVADVREMMKDLQKCASNLLLFLQNIKKITFHQINNGELKPTLLFEITKHSLPMQDKLPQQVDLSRISLRNESQTLSSEHWLVSTEVSTINGKHSTTSVACSLTSKDDSSSSLFSTTSLSSYSVNDRLKGEIFCFLALAQKTGLPLHISANFAVINNRRGIWTSDEATSKTETEVKWNISLVESVIPKAYLNLLLALQSMQCHKQLVDYQFYALWPLKENLKQENPWKYLIAPLYRLIAKKNLFLSTTKEWLHLRSCKMVKQDILEMNTPQCVLDALTHLQMPLVDLPVQYQTCLSLKEVLITEESFVKLFFENLAKFKSRKQCRNEILQILLDEYANEYDDDTERSYFLHEYLSKYPCIPSSPDGTSLQKCSKLIDRDSPFSRLYDDEDGRFPDKQIANRSITNSALQTLGILVDEIPWEMLIERAQTVPSLMKDDKIKALKRVKLIVTAIEKSKNDPPSDGIQLQSIVFLPVLPKPSDYPLNWKGEGISLSCGSQLVVTNQHKYNNIELAGSQVSFLCEDSPKEGGCGAISERVYKILHITSYPTCENVIQQLKQIIATTSTTNSDHESINRMCREIYFFLDRQVAHAYKIQKPNSVNLAELKKVPCIWTNEEFVNINQVSHEWRLNGPHLYTVPHSLAERTLLCQALGIKKEFSTTDIIGTLEKISNKFGPKPIDEPSQAVISHLLPLLYKIKPKHFIMLPDEKFIMKKSSDLAYNDAQWAPHDEKYTYVNGIFSGDLARQLKVVPVSSDLLKRYVITERSHFAGVEFGQTEKLTDRIKNILKDYPFNITVLKELLQNADDAKATKMYVILDKRVHGQKSVFSENWQKLQGPALLVWNDSIFTDKDIKGIQQLGLGSKRADSETIGQYGIGFNVVYHLTDCPSFVTDGASLCVFDPHCHFIPGATIENPGRMLSGDVWEKYPDISHAYLRDNLRNCPTEVLGGSLFRFPLRSDEDLVEMSKIVEDMGQESAGVITAEDMHKNLRLWAPQMKNAMFFLNHVTELKFMLIEKDTLITEFHYTATVDPDAQAKREELKKKVSEFSPTQHECLTIHYPIELSEVTNGQKSSERWIIQQGVGDINNEHQKWEFIKVVKPKHGIAAPVHHWNSPPRSFSGQVFCFLPLPIHTNLPVHINGNFVLSTNRRNLWIDPDVDAKTKWNKNLLRAIASSYAVFLTDVQGYFFTDEMYSGTSEKALLNAIDSYYSIYPRAKSTELEKLWLTLAEDVFRNIVNANSPILGVTLTKKAEDHTDQLYLEWHCPSSEDSSIQPYFWDLGWEEKNKTLRLILESIGMKITPMSFSLKKSLNKALTMVNKAEMLDITHDTVFSYYTKHASLASFPCPITVTAFKNTDCFKQFTKFLLHRPYMFSPDIYSGSPFGHPLLLTEDENLRKFDQEALVMRSEYARMYPKCLHEFLHTSMIEVMRGCSYFADFTNGWDVIKRILSQSLPNDLHSMSKVDSKLLKDEEVRKIWECFTHDDVFKNFLTKILKNYAIIPCSNGFLYSTKNPVKPIYVSDPGNCDIKLYEVLKGLGVPFVITTIVNTKIDCPTLSDCEEIISSLYHLHQEVDLTSLMTSSIVSALNNFFEPSDDLRYYSEEVRKHLLSLPLYETVDGKYTSVYNKHAYIWPGRFMCDVAFTKWKQYTTDVVFLKTGTNWQGYTRSSDIKEITAEEVYVKFVFPNFRCLIDGERYKHLLHIRDTLFDDSLHFFKSRAFALNRDRHQRATNFIQGLHELRCLGNDGDLQKVSSFCDHTLEIFKIFSQKYPFVPETYRENKDEEEKWLKFFKELGLRDAVSKEDFKTFCTEVSTGKHHHLTKASNVLVKHLLSDATSGWQMDERFLEEISRIDFMTTAKLDSLDWLAKQARCSKSLPQGNVMVTLTSPSKAATEDCAKLLWTVKTIVNLQQCITSSNIVHLTSLLSCLKITQSSDINSSDVISNISNICNASKFSDFLLFDQYPDDLRPPDDNMGLMQVMSENFSFLDHHDEELTKLQLTTLSSLPCVPVYSTPQGMQRWQVVLVKPGCVVDCPVGGYHPFLHRLPDEMRNVSSVLRKIGVKSTISLCHLQTVLHSAHTNTAGNEMDINTKRCVIEALKTMKNLLEEERDREVRELSEDETVAALSPLYLPNTDQLLTLSTNLIYGDTYSFRQVELDLSETEYSQFSLNKHYNIKDYEFCALLPTKIRPKKMSELCKQQVSSDQSKPTDDSTVTKRIRQTLSLELVPKAASKLIESSIKSAKNDQLSTHLLQFMNQCINGIRVSTIKNLKTSVILKESGKVIGSSKAEFFLRRKDNDQGCDLYLDSKLEAPLDDHVIKDLVNYVLSQVEKNFPSLKGVANQTELRDNLNFLLKVQNPSQIDKMMEKAQITLESEMRDPVQELGTEVPACWHHRLEQGIDNIFYPTEWVGYEDQENHIVFAQIGYPILPDDTETLENISKVNLKYKIYLKEDDSEGIDVSGIELFKFRKGLKRSHQPQNTDDLSESLVLYDEDAQTTVTSKDRSADLKAAKQKVCKELEEIWKLPEDLKKKAIKRLYLKWHPDKNPDDADFAEEIFKFLKIQIERLESGKSTCMDEDSADDLHTRYQSKWSQNFSHWNFTAHEHSHWFNFEQKQHKTYSSEFGGHSSFFRSNSFFNQEEDPNYNDRQMKEGQRWIKQAEIDFGMLEVVNQKAQEDPDLSGYGLACFLSHQVAEKALQGGVFALCGEDKRNKIGHKLTQRAFMIQAVRLGETIGLLSHVTPLENYYLDTRYPNRWEGYDDIPADHYDASEASEATEHARFVLEKMKSLMMEA